MFIKNLLEFNKNEEKFECYLILILKNAICQFEILFSKY